MSRSGSTSMLKGVALVALGAVLALAVPHFARPQRDVAQAASPLRQHLAAKRAAIDALATRQAAPLEIRATITAESRSGVRRLRIGEFQSLSDSDRSYAGYNLGAGSWDSLVGTLASAIADEYVVQAALRGVALDALDVVFTSRPEDPAVAQTRKVRYPRNLGYVAYIDSPASDAELEGLAAPWSRLPLPSTS